MFQTDNKTDPFKREFKQKQIQILNRSKFTQMLFPYELFYTSLKSASQSMLSSFSTLFFFDGTMKMDILKYVSKN